MSEHPLDGRLPVAEEEKEEALDRLYKRHRGLKIARNPQNGYSICWFHYSADPAKDEAWAEKVRRECASIEEYNQEYEIDFSSNVGCKAYPGFRRDIHSHHLKAIPHREVWRGWDFGFGHPACVWAQVNDNGRLNVLRELLGVNVTIDKFAQQVLDISAKEFISAGRFRDAGDPACRHRNDKSERTTADILRSMGIKIESRPTLVKDGITLIRRLLLTQGDVGSKLAVDERYCPILTEGFAGGYVLEDPNDLVPKKDGFYDHLQDAQRYLCVILFDMVKASLVQHQSAYTPDRDTASKVTGY